MGVCVPLCKPCWFFFFLLKKGNLLRWRSDNALYTQAREYLPVCVGAAQTSLPPLSVCLSLPLILCLLLLQSSPQNRPLIIVWCVSGSAVRSYKQGMDVFIADMEREAGAPLEGWWRQITEARIETFSAGHEATSAPPRLLPPPPSALPRMGVLFGQARLLLGWLWAGLDGEAATWPWDTLQWSAHAYMKIYKHIICRLCILSYWVAMESLLNVTMKLPGLTKNLNSHTFYHFFISK